MGVRVGVGFGRFPFETIASFRRWLDACEASVIDSIWQSDRVISKDLHLEPLSVLAMIAGATRRLKFGTNAIVLDFRDPLTFARQCASIDFLSDGRFLPMVGIGRKEGREWRATGRQSRGRGARADEALEIITRLWSEKTVSFCGEHFRVEEACISPRPVQSPLPLWIGGSSRAAVRRTARFGTGWLAPLDPPARVAASIVAIRKESSRFGRPIPEDHYGATVLFRVGKPSRSAVDPVASVPKDFRSRIQELIRIGDVEDVLDSMQQYRQAGVEKFIAIPMVQSESDYLEQSRVLEQEIIPEAMSTGWGIA